MIDDAIDAQVEEGDQLDWKSKLPEAKELAKGEFPKDVAAFANSGGGILVYGVKEDQRKATARVDVGEIDENYERTLRRVAVSNIHPPVFGLDVVPLGEPGNRVLAVVVPPSPEVPHMIYRGEYFGAPIRNHADTEWMGERHLETLYRTRFEQRRSTDTALLELYDEIAAGRDTQNRAWLVIVGQPRTPTAVPPLDSPAVRKAAENARDRGRYWTDDKGSHPFSYVDTLNPRRGLRRWVLRSTSARAWSESWASVHDSGAISLATAIGARRIGGAEPTQLEGHIIQSMDIEAAVADAMCLLRTVTTALAAITEYDVVLGIEWAGDEHLLIETVDGHGFRFSDTSIPLARYTKVRSAVRLDVDTAGYFAQTYALAQDAVNQGGIQHMKALKQPDPD